MFAAGFDPLVGAAIVLLGAGVGCLGSTVNPFAVGACIDSLTSIGIEVNQGHHHSSRHWLWLASLVVAILFVIKLCPQGKGQQGGSTILSLQEMEEAKPLTAKEIRRMRSSPHAEGLPDHLRCCVRGHGYWLHPLGQLLRTAFEGWSAFFTGLPLGEWLPGGHHMVPVPCHPHRHRGQAERGEIVNTFLSGAGDMMSVVMVIPWPVACLC